MNTYETARNMVQQLLKGEQNPTPELIREKVQSIVAVLPQLGFSEVIDAEVLIRELETLYSIWIAQGTILEDKQDHIPWLPDRKAEVNWDFWDRYRRYPEEEKGWSLTTVDRLEQLTDSILGRLEEPQRAGNWSRRGMVVGQVQSGKTSNYTGLICKAVDAGYKLIIVLAGLHNSLRSQTQLRLDEGFLGWDSQNNRAFDTGNRFIGAGLIPTGKQLRALPVTSSAEKGDFSKRIADQCGAAPGGADPILMVVKKNKTVLTNLVKWALTWAKQDSQLGRKVVKDYPLLVIDDEADNASVNTKEVILNEDGIPREEQEATAINKLIRQLLNSFEKNAYVGYTATPFANIFIHDKVDTNEYGKDLFPRHFIINLPAPSNYIGPVQVFGLDADSTVDLESVSGLDIVRIVEDQDEWMPTGHKKEHVPPYLPTSLKEAIRVFILSCAVRLWRGQATAHNSMLVHVTRFKAVQELVSQLIKDELTSLQRRLRYSEGNALNQVLDEFEYLWNTDFIPTSKTIIGTELQPTGLIPAWNDIEPLLYQAAARIQVRKINDDKSKDVLDYWSSLNGLNVIAVGGDKLSRGLTLEGLSVSYYLRASKMYDTLMQMGRWFGYRPGYLDLCRLYTTDEPVEWYQHITVASEELRKEFDYMANMSATPEEFGIKVRTHPSGLIITGANKMRNGTVMQLSFAGTISETYLFYKDENIIRRNLRATEDLISGLGTYVVEKNNFIWKQVAGSKIVDFLTNYQSHPNARLANTRSLVDYIEVQLKQNELVSWTIALISKKQAKNKHTIAGLEVGLIYRKNDDPSLSEYRLPKSRLLNPPDEMLDFPPSVQEEIINITKERRQEAGKPESKSKTPDGKVIREKRNPRNGLLLLYPLDPKAINTEIPVIGFGISFPSSNSAKSVEYKVNNIYWEQEFLDSYED